MIRKFTWFQLHSGASLWLLEPSNIFLAPIQIEKKILMSLSFFKFSLSLYNFCILLWFCLTFSWYIILYWWWQWLKIWFCSLTHMVSSAYLFWTSIFFWVENHIECFVSLCFLVHFCFELKSLKDFISTRNENSYLSIGHLIF